jgi:AcrR family transcriptional regulator
VPKLWNETIATHREAVREAVLETTWQLVTEQGLAAVTMSQIAAQAGIGRATLYKYFPDVESILLAWHERQIAAHLHRLHELSDRPGSTGERLSAVLTGYAFLSRHRGRHAGEVAAFLHRGEHTDEARQRLVELVRELLADAAAEGAIRDDVPPGELAAFSLNALAAAADLADDEAVPRLVGLVLGGLAKPAEPAAGRRAAPRGRA